MNVSLTPEQAEDELQSLRLAALRAEIEKGLDDIANGRVREGREVIVELKRRYDPCVSGKLGASQ